MAMRQQGTVKWFNKNLGFGFIRCGAGEEDVFVHFKSVRPHGDGDQYLNQNDKVEFDVSEGNKGLRAEDVCLIE